MSFIHVIYTKPEYENAIDLGGRFSADSKKRTIVTHSSQQEDYNAAYFEIAAVHGWENGKWCGNFCFILFLIRIFAEEGEFGCIFCSEKWFGLF